MARTFDGSTQKLQVSAAPLGTTLPAEFSIAVWVNPTDFDANNFCFALSDVSQNDEYMWLSLTSTDGFGQLSIKDTPAGTGGSGNTGNSMTAASWNHIFGKRDASNLCTCIVNGDLVNKASATHGADPTNLDTVTVGGVDKSGADGWLKGAAAHAVIWDVTLSDAEAVALAKGCPPLLIRPKNIVFYAPVGIGDPEPDFSLNGNDLTLTASPTIVASAPVGAFFGRAGATQTWDGDPEGSLIHGKLIRGGLLTGSRLVG